jgi:hypothetical protein
MGGPDSPHPTANAARANIPKIATGQHERVIANQSLGIIDGGGLSLQSI